MKLKGSGPPMSKKNYSYKDHSSIGAVSYYRLKQVDYDGVYDYSETIRIETGNDAGHNSYNMYPTTVTSSPISLNANQAFEVREIKVFGISGASQEHDVSYDRVHPSEIKVNTYRLENGIYLLRMITTEGEVVSRKFVVQ